MNKKRYRILILIIIIFASGILLTDYFKRYTCIKYTNNYWIDEFNIYFQNNDIKAKADNLKKDMDEISIEYVNQYLKNSKFWNKCINHCIEYKENNLWSGYDKKLSEEFEKLDTTKLYKKFNFNPYIFKSNYGMRDLPKSILDEINGKDILDIGAWPGDTAYTFHKYFPKSDIFAFEPVSKLMKEVSLVVDEMKIEEPELKSIHLIEKGVGSGEYKTEISYEGFKNLVQIVSLDSEYPKIKKSSLGLIKMDTEGYESDIIEGAQNIIKEYKPVLVVAIYHTPEDFFEMKDKLKALNPQYKFMIRRSENIISDADLVLIAY